ENDAMTLVWEHPEYDQETAANYSVEFATAGTEFAEIIDGLTGLPVSATPLTMTTNRFAVLSVQKLNDIAIAAGIEPFVEGNLEVRIKSFLGENIDLVQYSNSITITVTPYVAVIPPLYLVGHPQGHYGLGEWDNTTAMPLRYIGDGVTRIYEAYVKVGAGQAFKFIGEQGTWDNGNYGTI